jgi:hypothetical protein
MSSFISFDNRPAIMQDARKIAHMINTLHNAVARHAKTDSAFMQSEYQKQIDACNEIIPATIASWSETYADQAGGSNWFNYTSGLHRDLVSEYLASQKVGA